jgi:hypothetical protein
MAYFGTSGPKSNFGHSIGAGYQRQINLNNARKSSPFGRLGEFSTKLAVENTIETRGRNLLDRANDSYNAKFTRPYGDVNEFKRKVDAWYAHEAEAMRRARNNLKKAQEKQRLAAKNIADAQVANDAIKAELAKITANRPEEADMEKVAQLTSEIQAIYPDYKVDNWATVKAVAEADNKLLIQAVSTRQKELDNATVVLDRVHMKGVEDWMVDGPLMRESKTALMVSPIMFMAGAGIVAYYLSKQRKAKRTATVNKSAAFAVFS